MSLDGFIAGPGDAMDWVFDFVAPDELPEIAAATGAMLIGRRTYKVGDRMEAGKERGQHRAARLPLLRTHVRPDPRAAGPAGPGGHVPQR